MRTHSGATVSRYASGPRALSRTTKTCASFPSPDARTAAPRPKIGRSTSSSAATARPQNASPASHATTTPGASRNTPSVSTTETGRGTTAIRPSEGIVPPQAQASRHNVAATSNLFMSSLFYIVFSPARLPAHKAQQLRTENGCQPKHRLPVHLTPASHHEPRGPETG